MHPYVGVLRSYMSALGQSDFEALKGFYTPDAKVHSPFLGELKAADYLARLAQSTTRHLVTPIDIFLSATERHHAIAYFRDDWTLPDGRVATFRVTGIFTFDPGSNKLRYQELLHDSLALRAAVGNPFDAAPAPSP